MKSFFKGSVLGLILGSTIFLFYSFLLKNEKTISLREKGLISSRYPKKIISFTERNEINRLHQSQNEEKFISSSTNVTRIEKCIADYKKLNNKQVYSEIEKLIGKKKNITYKPGYYSENFINSFSLYYLIYKITDSSPQEAINWGLGSYIGINLCDESTARQLCLPSIWEQTVKGGLEEKQEKSPVNRISKFTY